MGDTKGSDSAPKPGTPEWQAAIEEHDAEVQASGNPNQTFEIGQSDKGAYTVAAFGRWLRRAWVAELDSEPVPTMAVLCSGAGA